MKNNELNPVIIGKYVSDEGLYEKDIVTKQDEAWLVYDIFLTQYVKTL